MKTYTVTIECHSNIEWTTTPDAITVEFTEAQLEKYKKAAAFCKEQNAFYIAFLWNISYVLYKQAEGDEDPDEVRRLLVERGEIIKQLSTEKGESWDIGDYVEFEPYADGGYKIGSSYLKVYSDEYLQVVLYLKHSNEEIWANLGKVDDIFKKEKA